MIIHGSLVVDDFLSFRNNVIVISKSSSNFLNLTLQDKTVYYTYSISEHLSGGTILLDLSGFQPSAKLCFLLPKKNAVGSMFTFKTLQVPSCQYATDIGYVEFGLVNNDAIDMLKAFYGTVVFHDTR